MKAIDTAIPDVKIILSGFHKKCRTRMAQFSEIRRYCSDRRSPGFTTMRLTAWRGADRRHQPHSVLRLLVVDELARPSQKPAVNFFRFAEFAIGFALNAKA